MLGGLLVQDRDVVHEGREQMRVISARPPERGAVAGPAVRLAGLQARALERDRDRRAASATIGIGAGQMSRVDAVRIAVEKARPSSRSCWRARRSPQTPSSRSPTAPSSRSTRASAPIIQPGGSVRDEEVIAAADAAGVAMVATGVRHFRH